MELRPLGGTGLRVSAIGLGTTKLGRNEQVKYPQPFELPSDAQVRGLLETARRCGVNLIDTAPAYGSSEARLGELLGDRDRWVLVTKAGEGFADGVSHFDFSPDAILHSVHRSLERLRTDRIDVVLLHCSGDDLPILRESGAVDALRSLKRSGVIRAFGASTKTVEGGLAAVELCDVVMVALDRRDRSQLPVVEAAREAQVGVLVKKPLASGHDPDPEAALRDVLGLPGVSCAVVGTIDAEHLAQGCRASAPGRTGA